MSESKEFTKEQLSLLREKLKNVMVVDAIPKALLEKSWTAIEYSRAQLELIARELKISDSEITEAIGRKTNDASVTKALISMLAGKGFPPVKADWTEAKAEKPKRAAAKKSAVSSVLGAKAGKGAKRKKPAAAAATQDQPEEEEEENAPPPKRAHSESADRKLALQLELQELQEKEEREKASGSSADSSNAKPLCHCAVPAGNHLHCGFCGGLRRAQQGQDSRRQEVRAGAGRSRSSCSGGRLSAPGDDDDGAPRAAAERGSGGPPAVGRCGATHVRAVESRDGQSGEPGGASAPGGPAPVERLEARHHQTRSSEGLARNRSLRAEPEEPGSRQQGGAGVGVRGGLHGVAAAEGRPGQAVGQSRSCPKRV